MSKNLATGDDDDDDDEQRLDLRKRSSYGYSRKGDRDEM